MGKSLQGGSSRSGRGGFSSFGAITLFIGLLSAFSSSATIVVKKLYINRGTFTTVNNTTFPALAFNEAPAYSSLNTVINIGQGDALQLTVINNDTVVHGFAVKGYPINEIINPMDTVMVTLTSTIERITTFNWLPVEPLTGRTTSRTTSPSMARVSLTCRMTQQPR